MLLECVLLISTLCHAVKDKPVMVLAVPQIGMMMVDGVTTRHNTKNGFIEGDLVARQFIGLRPTWPRMILFGTLQTVAQTYAAEKMRRSRFKVVRALWWIPQTLSIGISTAEGVQNNLHYY